MVLETQKWLNRTYGNDNRYVVITEDGLTGWETIYGLLRAFQIELGMSETGISFGPNTKQKMTERFPNGIQQQTEGASESDNIYSIIQGALWCKGYAAEYGTLTAHFYNATATGLKQLKADMGISSDTATITINIMDALLSMKQYKLVSGGSTIIRNIQQTLNGSYENYIGLIPCDGYYGREMNTGLIQVLQAVEGYTPEVSNGNFGEGTKSRCPIIPWVNDPAAIKLVKYALCCNGYIISNLDGTWTAQTEDQVKAFQTEYCLTSDGIVGVDTWMALLLSCGNPSRSVQACDCATVLNSNKAIALYNAGYRYVGRYLTGYVGSGDNARPKAMTATELDAIFDAGLNVFAIYQDNIPTVEYYTKEQGRADGVSAVTAAKNLGIPEASYIYFAVDCDMMDYQVTSNAIPYFEGVREAMRDTDFLYRVGIYGSRNICTRVCNKNLAKSSFVADMSRGYSGNMGFTIPKNWAFDQFSEYVFTGAAENFDLDKDAYSGRYSGFDQVDDIGDDYVLVAIDDVFRDRAEYLLGLCGIKINPEFAYNVDIPLLETNGVNLTYRIERSAALEGIPSNAEYVTIRGNQVIEAEMTQIQSVFDNLDIETKQLISNDGTLNISNGFVNEIGTGRMASWFEFDTEARINLNIAIEEELFGSEITEDKLCIYISISIDNDGSYDNEFSEIQAYDEVQNGSLFRRVCIFIVVILMIGATLYAVLTGNFLIPRLLGAILA